MRLILKMAFLAGLASFVVPGARPPGGDAASLPDPFTLAAGAQQAAADLGGFCERAPAACAGGQALAAFAGERVVDGLRLAASLSHREGAGDPAPGSDLLRQITRAEPSLGEPARLPGTAPGQHPHALPARGEAGAQPPRAPVPQPAPRA